MAASALTDIRIHVGMLANRKIKRLQRELGAEGVLTLIRLWCYCATNEPDGAMIGWEAGDVESAGEWAGERDAFVTQCERIGLLDRLNEGGWEVHDWAENQPWAAGAMARSERNKAAAQKRWDRQRAKLNGCVAHAECMHDACGVHAECNAPSLSSPSPSLPLHTSPTKRQRASKPALVGFAEFWQAYPRKEAKAVAEKAWARVDPDEHAAIMTAVSIQSKSDQWTKDGGKFIPMPATWINQRRWEDEGTEAPPPARKLNKAEQLHEDNQRSLQIVLERMAARGMEVKQDD